MIRIYLMGGKCIECKSLVWAMDNCFVTDTDEVVEIDTSKITRIEEV